MDYDPVNDESFITPCPRGEGEELHRYLSRRTVFAVADQLNHLHAYEVTHKNMKNFIHEEIENVFNAFKPDVKGEDYE